MIKFKSDSDEFCLLIPRNLLGDLKTFLKEADLKETGGILIGSYNVSLREALLHSFSAPPKDSKAGCLWFQRGNEGLKDLLLKNWCHGYYYIGEWHFHPKSSPNPSSQDVKQMKKIAKDDLYQCPTPIMIIAGGISTSFQLRAFVFNTSEDLQPIELHNVEFSSSSNIVLYNQQ